MIIEAQGPLTLLYQLDEFAYSRTLFYLAGRAKGSIYEYEYVGNNGDCSLSPIDMDTLCALAEHDLLLMPDSRLEAPAVCNLQRTSLESVLIPLGLAESLDDWRYRLTDQGKHATYRAILSEPTCALARPSKTRYGPLFHSPRAWDSHTTTPHQD